MKKAIITCSLDGFANSIKPKELKKFLERNSYSVELYSTSFLSRSGNKGIKRLLPYPNLLHLRLFILEGLYALSKKQKNKSIRKFLISSTLESILKIRSHIIQHNLKGREIDLLIVESNFDEAVISKRVARTQILDLPSPLAEESFYGNELSEKKYQELKKFEQSLYGQADYISFHWHTYAEFVKREKYNGANFINLHYGTTPKSKFASYSQNPKIAFLGYLGGYWTNINLLKQLSDIYPIDIYGGPEVPGLKNFKGYAPSLDVLADYQFGLITISDDPLRKNSFSSKQLEYLSYGLPCLVPDWRKDTLLDDASIYFNQENFIFKIKEYSDQKKWQEKNSAALKISQELTWEHAFEALKHIL